MVSYMQFSCQKLHSYGHYSGGIHTRLVHWDEKKAALRRRLFIAVNRLRFGHAFGDMRQRFFHLVDQDQAQIAFT